MTRTVQTAAHLSIGFTAEELTVLAADLGHDPRRTGVALPDQWTRRERELALDVAARSLRSRRVLTESDGTRQMAYAVAALVDIVCVPAVRLRLWAPAPVRFLAQPDATVRVREQDGLYELTPFATADLLGWLAAEAGLAEQPAAAGGPVDLPTQSYVELRAALRAGTAPAGDAPVLPAALAAALAGSGDRALSVRRRDERNRVVGGELAWVGDGAGLWSVPTVDQPMAGSADSGASAAGAVGSATVRIEPVSAQGILDTVIGFLRDEA